MKKILILSHNLLGSDTNMGITLNKFFSEIEDERLGQIYFKEEYSTRKHEKLLMTDKEAFKSIFLRKQNWRTPSVTNKDNSLMNTKASRLSKKLMPLFVRDLVWKLSSWKSNKLDDFVSSNNYIYIFLAPGYSNFIYEIARYLSNQHNIPIITYFADDYYNGLNFKSSLLSRMYQKKLNRNISSIVSESEDVIAITQTMNKKYSSLFSKELLTFYTPGDILNLNDVDFSPLNSERKIKIIYGGNLQLGRLEVLIKFLEVLEQINLEKEIEVTVCGSLSEKERGRLNSRFGPVFKGFVERDQLKKLEKNSDVLLHVESFDKKYIKRTKHSFSTKIADYLISNKQILVIGPKEVETVSYTVKNDVGYTITDMNTKQIETVLTDLINDVKGDKIENAHELYRKNHTPNKITDYFISKLK